MENGKRENYRITTLFNDEFCLVDNSVFKYDPFAFNNLKQTVHFSEIAVSSFRLIKFHLFFFNISCGTFF